jgi:hypothetical protein
MFLQAVHKQQTLLNMNNARKSIIEYLKNDLALLRRIGTSEERAEIPHVESVLDGLLGAGEGLVVSFATERKTVRSPDGSVVYCDTGEEAGAQESAEEREARFREEGGT